MGQYKSRFSDEYRRQVLKTMRTHGWTIDKTAKHFHHSWTTVERWQRESGETEADDEPMSIVIDSGRAADPNYAPQHRTTISYHIEVVKLQAELDMVKAMYQELLAKVVDRGKP